jgi:hypothetical protein
MPYTFAQQQQQHIRHHRQALPARHRQQDARRDNFESVTRTLQRARHPMLAVPCAVLTRLLHRHLRSTSPAINGVGYQVAEPLFDMKSVAGSFER